MRSVVQRAVAAGLLLGISEWLVTLPSAWGLMLSHSERARYLASSAALSVSLVVLLSLFGRRALGWVEDAVGEVGVRRRLWLVTALPSGLLAGLLAWSLTGGRRVADLALRPLLVLAFSLGIAFASAALLQFLRALVVEDRRRARVASAVALALLTPTLLLADVRVLPRLYPAFHLGLSVASLASATLFGALDPGLSLGRFARAASRLVPALAILALPFAVYSLVSMQSAPNLGYVVEERAPLTGKALSLVMALSPAEERPDDSEADVRARAAGAIGIELPDPNILLITVDALRADRLEAYGGEGLTPQLDALARESVVFLRAYTPTPHTSYALTSMLTGKYLRPVLELPDAPTDHPTLPEILRQYGHRTAAFFPPAIFFVDAGRFASLEANGFGFEYQKKMYASAHERIGQLEVYLEEVGAERPLFVWVHLFEPHEPYDPDPRFRRGDSAEARYDGEVAASDDAIGGLVRSFRAARPGATVIISADHGEEFGDHGGHFHGSTLYEEQVSVPLLWSTPGIEARTSERPVELVDIATTVLASLGIPRDARMRGDDIGPLLRGEEESGPDYAFAGIGDERMIVDGRYKAICSAGRPTCRLYDLETDPRERRNLAAEDPERAAAMRAALGAFIGSIPRVEAIAMQGEHAWPEPLARAALGDPTVGPDVLPLLGDGRVAVREAAARAMASLRYPPARPILARLMEGDVDPSVRAEAALALLAAEDARGASPAREIIDRGDATEGGVERARRAALLLAGAGDAHGLSVLLALVVEGAADEETRRSAVEALGQLRRAADRPETTKALLPLLRDVRLRADVARALGSIGARAAADALHTALEFERYAPAREAEAEALVALGDRRVRAQIVRFLGMESSIPNGVALLAAAGERGYPLLPLSEGLRGLGGEWRCLEGGCVPGASAALSFGAARRATRATPSRVVLRVHGVEGSALGLDERALRPLRAGWQEVSFAFEDNPSLVALRVVGDAMVFGAVRVPQTEEIPPPAPEPWQEEGGEGEGASQASSLPSR